MTGPTWHGYRAPATRIDPDHTVAMSFWQSRAGIDPRQLVNVRELAREVRRA